MKYDKEYVNSVSENKRSLKRLKYKLWALFLSLSLIVFLSLTYLENNNHKAYINETTSTYFRAYSTVYKHYKELSSILHSGLSNLGNIPALIEKAENADEQKQEEVRNQIYKGIIKRYKKLKQQSITEIVFYTKDNKMFLDMNNQHRHGFLPPENRLSIRQVNKTGKPQEAFENGSFRFVYPLKNSKGKLLGSMDISFGPDALTGGIMRQYYVLSNFFIKENSFSENFHIKNRNRFVPSHHTGFLSDTRVLSILKKTSRKKIAELKPDEQTINIVYRNAHSDQPVSYYEKDINMVFTTIPVFDSRNNMQAFLSVRSRGNFVSILNKYFNIVLVLSVSIVALILGFIYNNNAKNLYIQKHLQKMVDDKTEENMKQFDILQQQSKLASMGEMIGAIAHQWRQPLNALNMNIQNLDDDYEDGLIDKEFINGFIETNKKTILFMSETIDDFRNFYRIDKIKEKFSIKNEITSVLSLQSALLNSHNIKVSITGDDFQIESYKSEFQQVVLNIINNAKDALASNRIENGEIKISLKNNKIFIEDNAGGIPPAIINRIFEPYFTTKDQGKGTGLGLYMSKMIIEDNMKGNLSITNGELGAQIVIALP